jgi:hypothetical protein
MSEAIAPGWDAGEEWSNLDGVARKEVDLYLGCFRPLLDAVRTRRRIVTVEGLGIERITSMRHPLHVVWVSDRGPESWRATLELREVTAPIADSTTPEIQTVQQAMYIRRKIGKFTAPMVLRRPELEIHQEGPTVLSSGLADIETVMGTDPEVFYESQVAWLHRLYALGVASGVQAPYTDAV